MYQVSLRACDTYEQDKVTQVIAKAMDDLGGVNRFAPPGSKVLIKTNLLKKNKPEDQVTTHPSVLIGVIRALQQNGVSDILVADSPGGPFSVSYLKMIYKDAGIDFVAEQTGVSLNYDTGQYDVYNEQGVILKQMQLCHYLLNRDVVIDCAKLKTHGMTGYTGAIKNMFGCIPGTTKVEYHYRMPELKDFSNMLLDLALYLNPALSVIDAIWGMEGDGPSAGEPRKVGALVLSDSPVGADILGSILMGLHPLEVCMLQRAKERGLIAGELEKDVELFGDPLEPLIVSDYKPARVAHLSLLSNRAPQWAIGWLERYLTPRPLVNKKTCIGCGVCAQACPPRAITMAKHLPEINRDTCIKCFCCSELCPYKAMKIKRPWISKYF